MEAAGRRQSVAILSNWYELRLLSPAPDDYNSMKVIARSAPFEVVTAALPTVPK
jgi:hypothetical protein